MTNTPVAICPIATTPVANCPMAMTPLASSPTSKNGTTRGLYTTVALSWYSFGGTDGGADRIVGSATRALPVPRLRPLFTAEQPRRRRRGRLPAMRDAPGVRSRRVDTRARARARRRRPRRRTDAGRPLRASRRLDRSQEPLRRDPTGTVRGVARGVRVGRDGAELGRR